MSFSLFFSLSDSSFLCLSRKKERFWTSLPSSIHPSSFCRRSCFSPSQQPGGRKKERRDSQSSRERKEKKRKKERKKERTKKEKKKERKKESSSIRSNILTSSAADLSRSIFSLFLFSSLLLFLLLFISVAVCLFHSRLFSHATFSYVRV